MILESGSVAFFLRFFACFLREISEFSSGIYRSSFVADVEVFVMFPILDTTRLPRERVGTLSNVALPPPADDEQALVRALRNRDEGAFEVLLERYDAMLLCLANRYVRSHEVAEEVVQDTWLAVLSGLDRFAGRSSLKTWIVRILINRARTRARREARTVPFSRLRPWEDGSAAGKSARGAEPPAIVDGVVPPPWRDLAWSPPSAEEGLLAQELDDQVRAAIEELPGQQRRVVELRDVEGWSAGEVQGELRLSEANQRVLLHRGRARLRRVLGGYLAEGPVAVEG
jgi:RNA polymerase sigma-70 factor (ECF subfamily)